MKIILISNLYPPLIVGGAEMAMETLSTSLVNRGHEVHVLTLCPPKNQTAPYKRHGVDVFPIPLRNRYWPYMMTEHHGYEKPESALSRLHWHVRDTSNGAMALAVREHAQNWRPDIALTSNLQGFSTAVWPALHALGIPILHTIHDFSLVCPRNILFRDGKNCGLKEKRCLECKTLTWVRHKHTKYVDSVVGVSQAVLRLHQEHGLFTHIPTRTIHNAMPEGVYPQARLRSSKDPRLTFGFLGRVERPKGFDTLMQALSKMPKDLVRLVVGGRIEPEYEEWIKGKYGTENITFLGFCDPEQVFSQIDVLVLPSFSMEALGNVVFEAYFRGIPVIGSSRGGIPEIIDIDHTGFVFPYGDSKALLFHMEKFLKTRSLAADMQADVLHKANSFVSERRIDAYLKMLDQVASANQHKPGAADGTFGL